MPQCLILVRGAQGSGKTTFVKGELSKLLVSQGRAFAHFEDDMFFMDKDGYSFKPELHWAAKKWCQEKADNALKEGFNTVVVSNTFTSINDLLPYLNIGFKYRVKLIIYHCVGEFPNEHNVPEDVVTKARTSYESLAAFGFQEIKINEKVEKEWKTTK